MSFINPVAWKYVNSVTDSGQGLIPDDFGGYDLITEVPFLTVEGKVAGAIPEVQGMIGRKRAEEALKWSSQRAELLSDTAARLLESDDPQGLVDNLCRKVMAFLDCQVFFNFLVDEAMERLRLNACAGIPEEEASKIEWLDYGVAVCGCVARDRQRIIAEDILQTSDRRTELVKSYGIQAYCCHPLLMQGRLIGTLSFGTRSRPRFSPDDIAVMKAVTDLVAVAMHRIETQRALSLSEARHRALVTASSQVIYRMNADWTEMHQLDGRDFLVNTEGPSGTWLEQYIPPEDQPHVTAAIQEAIRMKRIFELEHRVRRADGTLGWMFSRAVPLLDATGAIVEWFGAARDITARKHAEEALRDADRRKDEFLATLAHELRNPLAPVRNSLELMKRAGDNAELMRRCREMMERQIGHMVRLIDDLLDVSRITHGKLELKRERIALASVVAQAMEACHAQVESAGHGLHVQWPQEPILLEADPVRLVQVIGNLLINACKYTPPGGRIWLTAEREGDQVQITVKDTGVGIPPDLLLNVFTPFTQVKRSPEPAPGGLGIGLSLVKRLVEMHDGTVTARSAGPGHGSEFTVRLPVLVEPPAAQTTELLASPVSATARRILVIDDNRDAADSLAVLLEVAGHDTRTAYDGEAGLKVAATFRPEVILLDLGMPTMDGYDTCRRIREQPWSEGMTVVALTGWGQEESRRKSSVAGFDGHLVKPVDYDALMKLIASLLADMEQPLKASRVCPCSPQSALFLPSSQRLAQEFV